VIQGRAVRKQPTVASTIAETEIIHSDDDEIGRLRYLRCDDEYQDQRYLGRSHCCLVALGYVARENTCVKKSRTHQSSTVFPDSGRFS